MACYESTYFSTRQRVDTNYAVFCRFYFIFFRNHDTFKIFSSMSCTSPYTSCSACKGDISAKVLP